MTYVLDNLQTIPSRFSCFMYHVMCCFAACVLAVVSASSDKALAQGTLLEDERNTVDVFKRTSESVVFINTTVREADFWSFDVSEVRRGSGSGFVWDTKGHIVTNFHVVNNASRWLVTLSGKTADNTFAAKLVGVDPSHDIAVLRIEAAAARLKPVQIGTSDLLMVGQKVLAIGNPFGLDQTLTRGIVSALGRDISSEDGRKLHDLIQTDASINPGNSGGPLLDSSARLIGMNTAIYSPSGASAGIGFAVPVSIIKRIVPQLIANGRVVRPGIGIKTVSDAVARANGIIGVVVASANELAERSGIKGLSRGKHGQIVVNDVVVGLENVAVRNSDDLFAELDKHKPGDVVELKILNSGKTRTQRVTLQGVE
jgi:S1-C subfamily serine protease